MLRQFLCVMLCVLFLTGCSNPTSDDEETYEPVGSATLQHHEEHAGIAVEVMEADTFVLTDSMGNYDLSFLPDGYYTLNCVFPYFQNEKFSITIDDGEVEERIPDVELQQLIEFSCEISDSIVHIGDTLRYSWYASNISSGSVPIHWYHAPPWITTIFHENTPIWSRNGPYTAVVDDTLLPAETDSSGGWLVIGNHIIDSTMRGQCSIVKGISTTDINNEVISTENIYNIYFPDAELPSSTVILAERVYKKLPRKYFEVR